MIQKEKFCKYSHHLCPDCGSRMKIMEIVDDLGDVEYAEKFEICEECGFQNNITDKRNKNNKVEVEE